MRKLYNTFIDLARNFKNFFNSISILSKPQLNFIANCIIGMIKSESVVTSDIIKKIPVNYFDESSFESKSKKFWRFFSNPRFSPYDFLTLLFNTLFLTLNLKTIMFIFPLTICFVKIDSLFLCFL